MKRNNAVGVKGRSGRKTDNEIVQKYIDLELANRIANRELIRIDEAKSATIPEMKVIVMPVAVKGMVEKKELSGSVEIKTITGMNIQSDGNNI